MHHIFGANWNKLKIPDKIKEQVIAASYAADKDGTTPVGEGIYMYLCFNTHSHPTVSMTLGYPSFRPSPFVKYLLENSKSPFDKAFDLRRRGGKRKKRKTKKKGKRTRKKRGGEEITPVVGQIYQSKSEEDYPILQDGYRVSAVKENHVWFNDVEQKPVFERDDELVVSIVEFPNLFMPQQTGQPGGRKKRRKRRKTKKKRKRKKSRKKRK